MTWTASSGTRSTSSRGPAAEGPLLRGATPWGCAKIPAGAPPRGRDARAGGPASLSVPSSPCLLLTVRVPAANPPGLPSTCVSRKWGWGPPMAAWPFSCTGGAAWRPPWRPSVVPSDTGQGAAAAGTRGPTRTRVRDLQCLMPVLGRGVWRPCPCTPMPGSAPGGAASRRAPRPAGFLLPSAAPAAVPGSGSH